MRTDEWKEKGQWVPDFTISNEIDSVILSDDVELIPNDIGGGYLVGARPCSPLLIHYARLCFFEIPPLNSATIHGHQMHMDETLTVFDLPSNRSLT